MKKLIMCELCVYGYFCFGELIVTDWAWKNHACERCKKGFGFCQVWRVITADIFCYKMGMKKYICEKCKIGFGFFVVWRVIKVLIIEWTRELIGYKMWVLWQCFLDILESCVSTRIYRVILSLSKIVPFSFWLVKKFLTLTSLSKSDIHTVRNKGILVGKLSWIYNSPLPCRVQ